MTKFLRKKTNLVYLSTLVLIMVAFTACNKNEEVVLNGESLLKTNQISIRTFTDINELSAEVDKTLAFTYEELVAYEQSLWGFNSFGKLADQAMMPILNDVESAMLIDGAALMRSDINQLVNANAQYLHIVRDLDNEEHFETKYFNSPFRYIMNNDRMFKVSTTYYKVFEDGYVFCVDSSYYSQLLNMSESDFSTLESNNIFMVVNYSDDVRSNYGWSKSGYNVSANGKERVYVEFKYYTINYWGLNGTLYTGEFRAKVYGRHKWCGIWWASHRTYTLNVANSKLYVNGQLKSGNIINNTKLAYNIEKLLYTAVLPYAHNTSNVYIHSAAGQVKIPAVTLNFNWQ